VIWYVISRSGVVISITNSLLTYLILLQASSRKEKVRALMTGLQKNWKDEYFQQMCVALQSVDQRLSDELSIELEAENGQQIISEALDLENGRIVFKEFGHEKRLSELEKKRLHGLLNRKSQCMRDIWERHLSRLNAKLDAVTQHNNTIDSEAVRLTHLIESFIESSAGDGFKNRAVVSTARTTGDLLRELPALRRLEEQLNCLIQLSGQSCLERDNIGNEKSRVLKRIGADDKQQPNNGKNTRPTGFAKPSGNLYTINVRVEPYLLIASKTNVPFMSDKILTLTRYQEVVAIKKVLPYSLPSVGPGADPGVQAVR